MGIKQRKLTYISLYCGCGGFDDGFIKNGFSCLGAFDIDQAAINVYNRNIGPYGHVWDLSSATLPYKIQEPVDVVISGSPCQGFSTVGKRDVNDPRNNLLLTGGEIALRLKAKIFIAENVMGSVAGKHKVYWDKLEKMFKDAGYSVSFIKCDARTFGIPQLRKRILMIARKGTKVLKPVFTATKMNTLREILDKPINVQNHDIEWLDQDSTTYKIALQIKPGQKLSNVRGSDRSVHTWEIPEVFGEINTRQKELLHEIMRLRRRLRKRKGGDADPVDIFVLKEHFGSAVIKTIDNLVRKGYLKYRSEKMVDLAHTFNGKYRRLCYSRPSPTVDTRFGSPTYFLHPDEHRPMTVREAARIQGFRDNFVFIGTTKQQFQMVGNAVPPPVSAELARTVMENLFTNAKKRNREKGQ